MWQQWINAVLGVWTIAVPFLGFTGATLTWVLAVTGIVIAVLALWGAGDENTERQHVAELEHRLQHQRG
jgi:hypothetical protein